MEVPFLTEESLAAACFSRCASRASAEGRSPSPFLRTGASAIYCR